MDQCPICLCDIGEKNRCVTECGHSFCLNCILRAAQENTACPMCRKVLVEPSKNTHSQEDINAAYRHGRDEGYEEGRMDAAFEIQEIQEEHDIEKQNAFDEGFRCGRAKALEILRLQEMKSECSQDLPTTNRAEALKSSLPIAPSWIRNHEAHGAPWQR
jgi:hypothetical protein